MLLFILSAILCCYAAMSYILLRFPCLIHRTKPLGPVPVHISHRGGAGERLENTMDAFQNAVSLGTDMLELDCHITRDSEVVILHDPNLKRITGVDVDVSNVNYNDLPIYLSKLEVEYHPGNHCKATPMTDLRFLRLEELLEAFPNVLMNIDIKQDDDRLIQRVAELLQKFQREDLTVWGSFSSVVAAKLQQANPRIKRFFPLEPVLWMFAGYFFGFLPFMSLPYDYLELPLICAFNYPQFRQSYCLQSFKSRAIMWFLDKLLMSPKLYKHLNARGIPVIFWVCNTTEDFKTAFAVGAQGIMTDYPKRLRAFLQTHSLPSNTISSSPVKNLKSHTASASEHVASNSNQNYRWAKRRSRSSLKESALVCATHPVQLHLSESVSVPCPEWRMT
ncbi:hypothetical protein CRM22_009147 [Opisthorchis felineus]|uniref:GP-PDE domain-containing protein n=1 Tax=Opisthorchis felineus TaxID=147828 RepID=A0A4S2L868_OPIFE|nr:hypothetical protein CRM22_009147 [Opisthorchis felineus]